MRTLFLFTVVASAIGSVSAPTAAAQSAVASPAQTPPAMLPYVAIHEPEFAAASDTVFALNADLVIGVAHRTTAKAYLAADLTQHGSVDDRMPDGPIEVTWCGTCGTADRYAVEAPDPHPGVVVRVVAVPSGDAPLHRAVRHGGACVARFRLGRQGWRRGA